MYFVVLCFTAEGVFVIRQNEFSWVAAWAVETICVTGNCCYIIQVKNCNICTFSLTYSK